jgi:hypothetical protein
MWSILSDERTVLPFTIAAGFASAVILGSESSGTRDHNFTVSDSRLPQTGGPSPRVYIQQEQRGPVIPFSVYGQRMYRTENTASNSFSIVALAGCSDMSWYCVYESVA